MCRHCQSLPSPKNKNGRGNAGRDQNNYERLFGHRTNIIILQLNCNCKFRLWINSLTGGRAGATRLTISLQYPILFLRLRRQLPHINLTRARSLAGIAPRLHRGGQRFESARVHAVTTAHNIAGVAQWYPPATQAYGLPRRCGRGAEETKYVLYVRST